MEKQKSAYSVLMAVYDQEKPAYLARSMESMLTQTVPTDDFVLVCDGPLTDELNGVIQAYAKQYPQVIRLVSLETHQGLGAALRAGLPVCRHEFIARMDSDDISLPTRCEQQLHVFSRHPELSIVGGYIEEFDTSPAQHGRRRIVPETDAEIRSFARRRSPFNHPTVMLRKSAVLAVGNYQNYPAAEDYDLFIRLLMKGFQGYNIPAVLVQMHTDDRTLENRRSRVCIQEHAKLFERMKKQGTISLWEMLTNKLIHQVAAWLTGKQVRKIYEEILRK